MADYSEAEARDARRIVEHLLDPERGTLDLEGALVVSDIEGDAGEFAGELQLLEDTGLDAPAVRVAGEDLVPVALSLLAGPAWPWSSLNTAVIRRPPWRFHPFFYETMAFTLRSILEDRRRVLPFETIPRDVARSTFLRRATDFLAVRIAAVQDPDARQSSRWSTMSFLNLMQRAGGPRVPTPGCNFSVSTNSRGLRVLWSGAYRVSSNYFSHPTTPALGVLQSGTYVFGVDGGAYGNNVQWDLSAVVTLLAVLTFI